MDSTCDCFIFCDWLNKQVSIWVIWSVRQLLFVTRHTFCDTWADTSTVVGEIWPSLLWSLKETYVTQKCHTIPSNNVNISFWGLALKGGQCKMQTAEWLRTIVFRVRKQWDHFCHVPICMVKMINYLQSAFYNDQ